MSESKKDVFNTLKGYQKDITRLVELFGNDIERTSNNKDILRIMEAVQEFSRAFNSLIEIPISKLKADFQISDEKLAEATKHSDKKSEVSSEECVPEAKNKEKLLDVIASTLEGLKNNEETLQKLLSLLREVESQERKAVDSSTLNDE